MFFPVMRIELTATLPITSNRLAHVKLPLDFPKFRRQRVSGTLAFYVKAMSRDGRVGEGVVRELINEQRELLNVKNEISLNQVSDFGPLQRVIKELNLNKRRTGRRIGQLALLLHLPYSQFQIRPALSPTMDASRTRRYRATNIRFPSVMDRSYRVE